jgi:membrane-bound lytic murein transglycosylase D
LLKNITIRLLTILSFLWIGVSPASATFPGELYNTDEFDFTVPVGLESRVDFWKKVYTQYSTRHVIIHDQDNLDIIYDVVYMGERTLSSRARNRKLRPHLRKYKTILRKLARVKNTINLTPEEERIYRMVKSGFRKASRNLRTQLGQSDRFGEGLKKSGRYMKDIKRIFQEEGVPDIKRIFQEEGVPEQLAVLPHVESSFQLNAYSSAGAAGIWQFTRSTGRLYMNVGYEIDERRDPLIAARAAARLLKYNYKELNSWPLAITAYNHGVNGMRRAAKRHGADIVNIIENYRSRRFGFASKNFFCEFMAALEVARHPRQYFPGIVINAPVEMVEFPIEDYVHVSTLEKYFGMTREEIAQYNPSLRRPVVSGKKRIPKDYVFKAPADRDWNFEETYASIPENLKFEKQVRVRWYTVQWGDNLSTIARRLGTSVWKLKELNQIRGHRIYRGQVLEIPGKAYKGGSRAQVVEVVETQPDWSKVEIPEGLETIKYRVRRKDTLTRIARKFKVHVSVLAKMNKMDDPHSLRPGQHIEVPKPGTDFEVQLASAASSKDTTAEPAKLKVEMSEVEAGENKVVASTTEPLEKTSKVETTLSSFAEASQMNKNRHAFRPVKMVSDNAEDYRVGLVKIDFDETLSHIADWARLSVRELRRLNNLRRRGSRIRVNQSIKVPFRRTTPEEFEQKRQEYHKAIQEDFFGSYQVEKVVTRKLKRGETLWEICNNVYSIPFWLLSNYNPNKDINSISIGESITIPILTDTAS